MAEHVPWERAELDASNSEIYDVEMVGDEVEWEFREAPDYYDSKGRPRTGATDRSGKLLAGHAKKLVKPARGVVTLRARSKDEARAAAIRTHPEYHTAKSVTKKA